MKLTWPGKFSYLRKTLSSRVTPSLSEDVHNFLKKTTYVRHFRSKLVNWNESVYCTPIDRALKMRFNEGWGSFLQPGVMKVFVKSIAPFFGQNKYTNIRRFSTIFRHKTRIFSLQKVQKIQFWVKWLHNIYLTKAENRTPLLFIGNAQI